MEEIEEQDIRNIKNNILAQQLLNSYEAIAFLINSNTGKVLLFNEAAAQKGAKYGSYCYEILCNQNKFCDEYNSESMFNNKSIIVENNDQIIEYTRKKISENILLIRASDISEKIRMENEINENKKRLENVIFATNAATWDWNILTNEINVNTRWAEIIGYTKEELNPINISTWNSLIYEEDRERSEIELNKHLSGQVTYYQCELRLKHRDGRLIWILDQGRVLIWTEDNKPLHMYGIHQDISERKNVEIELKLSELTYRKMLNEVTELIYIQDQSGRFLDVNATVEKIYGYERNDFIGRTPEFLAAPGLNDLEIVETSVSEALKGNPKRFEFWAIKKDGTIFLKEVTTTQIYYFGEKAVLAIARDITERKNIEQKILQSAELYEMLTNTSMDGYWLCDIRGNILEVNNAYCKMTGYTKEEIINMGLSQLEANENQEEILKHIQRLMIYGYGKFETKHKCKNGESKSFEISATYSVKLKKILAFLSDITDRKRAEKDLFEQMEAINKFNRLMLGREERMIELKKEINDLLEKLQMKKKYRLEYGEE